MQGKLNDIINSIKSTEPKDIDKNRRNIENELRQIKGKFINYLLIINLAKMVVIEDKIKKMRIEYISRLGIKNIYSFR